MGLEAASGSAEVTTLFSRSVTPAGNQRRSSRCLQATSSVAMGKAFSRAFGIGLPQLSQ
jgi:hypothetical protein